MDTRGQLIAATAELMIERNSIDISLSDIAQKSGHNSALVGYYFGNKTGLMVELLRKTLGPGMTQLDHLVKLQIPATDKLRIHISGIVNAYYRHPFVNRLMHHVQEEDKVKYGAMVVAEFAKPLIDVQKHILDEGVAQGIFRPVDPMLFYFHIVGACDFFFHGRISLREAFGIPAMTEDLKKSFIDYLYDMTLNGLLKHGADAPA